ncbi:acetylornithine deacetylase/succinyl-diaminopimelate desuccinylase family protein [Bacillus sp. SORGH_AS 510]|uniref:acetylornithine deacetylase n=1 Tax=Bacillus sp. SORGH_AS_0510 TaxID=3041771 RepID=UPI002784C300|nr:acetylornithine deacetylase [Bacillus sp. SORGH_AS_0510]MDQ1146210.1 acetylornithine deacetylase/succinyl-diaminopimelate desuccinylase family protein [Bacillus sp. SORGH_AS_0510]
MWNELAEKIAVEVESRKEELLELLSTLVAFPTVSPPARNTNEIQGFIKDYLDGLDFQTDQWDVYAGDPNVVGILKGESSGQFNSLIINGHVDVAEVGDDREWVSSPFSTRIIDSYVYGRGVADMKGGMAASLFAIKLLKEMGISLSGDLHFQSVIGEEVGEAGTQACVERGYTADYAVVVDTSDLHIQGQGGVITGWITIQSKETYHDGLRRKMIHAGGGVKGASAIEKMMKIITGLQELERHWAITKSYEGFPPGTNTINPAVIEGGRHAAFVADQCALWITVHFYPNEDFEEVIKEIEQHIGAVAAADPWLRENPPTFVWGGKSMIEDRGEIFPSLELDRDHLGTKALTASYEKMKMDMPNVGMSTTVTDAGWLGRAGIPTAIFGPGKLEDAHAVNEKLEICQLLDFTKIIALFIAEWCNTKKEG